ncbi:hypothetical protein DXG03_003101 [Asterophora parasitica]|uniref:Chloride channel protein n=1 Tax=Asterophora parasitica TaxID=117018 RepID=A0A9P7GJK0_9AGAR|nr:hypothetical protein DXG03_003101 [Asterophora parasitica]
MPPPDSPAPGVDGQGTSNGPSSTTWRRERLMRIGSSATVNTITANNGAPDGPSKSSLNSPNLSPTESTSFQFSGASYGTLPASRRRAAHPNFNHTSSRRAVTHLPSLSFLRRTTSNPSAPPSAGLRDMAFSRLGVQRPISSYDAPLRSKDDSEPDADAKINGIRVWYSSFTSIDWLHDAIKDSVRFSRLRRRKSLRSRIRLVVDKSLGWFVVTIVGFLSAIVAFIVVRSELWLFDTKEGYCRDAWWKAKRFCCPALDDIFTAPEGMEVICQEWRTWADVFSQGEGGVGAEFAEHALYALIALELALVSTILTIYLTNSTTFVTRKESGVLKADFPGSNPDSKDQPRTIVAKRKIMYYAAGSGIPEIKTILSGFVIHGYLGGRVLFTKSVGLALSVASGLSLGKEGPFVHIASCIGNIVSRFFSKYENNEAITLKMLDPFGTGKLVLFQVTYGKDWHAYELFPFILLGVFGGVYGAYFSKLNHRWSKHVRNKTWLKSHPIAEVLLISTVTTILCFVNPYTRMSGTELVASLFSECHKGAGRQVSGLCSADPSTFFGIWPVVRAISVAMIVKAGLTVVTFGIKVPAGIFIPSLGVGACAGRVMGILMQWLQYQDPGSKMFAVCGGDMDCIIPGLYAMVGAAATLSGVTRTTVSLAVIMFELTDTLTYAVPVMLSVLVAKTVADALEPKGIYDLVIELNQLPYLDSKHEYLWGNLQINDVTSCDVEIIRLDRKNTVKSLRDQLFSLTASGNDDSGFPILRRDVNDDGLRMVGYIGASELEHALSLVADEEEDEIHFHTTYNHNMGASSISSLLEESAHQHQDLFDFSDYMDQVRIHFAYILINWQDDVS